MRYAVVASPLGDLVVWGDGDTLSGLSFADSHTSFAEVAAQLRAYFAGERTEFTLKLDPHGTAFQRRVWDALEKIPFGTTTTYGQIAAELGDPRSTRVVGLANGRNPIAIIIPCHRVIGADGNLTGYGGGMDRKRWLLAHESGAVRLPW